MKRGIAFSLGMVLISGCINMARYKTMTPEQRVALVECDGSLPAAKKSLVANNFDILEEREGFFYTDWKHSKDAYWTRLWPEGVFLKYKVRKKPNGKLEWSEFKSPNRTDSYASTDDFYAGTEALERQNQVRKMICGGATPELLLPKTKAKK